MADTADRGHGTGARLFHWLTAVLVFVQIPAGVAMTSEGFDALRDPLFIVHKGLGSLLLALVLLRVAWKAVTPAAPPLPDSIPERQRFLARSTHVGLYVLLIVMTTSGYARVRTGDYPIEVLDALGFPTVLPVMPDLSVTLSVVHKVSAYVLVALLSGHVAAAVYHGWIRRDGVLGRMWPPVR